MKQNLLKVILMAEAAICIAFCILRTSTAELFTAAAAFPFEQIGTGLRALSLSGAAGNKGAVAIYVAISLLPGFLFLVICRKRTPQREDILLLILCPVLFVVLYLMINPGFLAAWTADAGDADGHSTFRAILGGVVYSVLCGYAVLRALQLFSQNGTEKLVRYAKILAGLLSVIFIFFAFGLCLNDLIGNIAALDAENIGTSGNESALPWTYVFLILQFAVSALPWLLSVSVVFAGLRLTEAFLKDRYSAETTDAAAKLSERCMLALKITVTACVAFNLLQLLFIEYLQTVNILINIPVFSFVFVLGVLLLTRLIGENKRLKDDNDMFV